MVAEPPLRMCRAVFHREGYLEHQGVGSQWVTSWYPLRRYTHIGWRSRNVRRYLPHLPEPGQLIMLPTAMAPAPGFDDRTGLPTFDIECIVPRVGVDFGVVRELPLRVFALAGRRVVIHHSRCCLPSEGPVVTHVTPQAPRAAFAFCQHRYRCVVVVDALGRMHMRLDRITQRHQCRGRCADPVGQRRDIKLNALACVDLTLPVERQVRAVLAEQDFGQQMRARTSTRDRMRRV